MHCQDNYIAVTKGVTTGCVHYVRDLLMLVLIEMVQLEDYQYEVEYRVGCIKKHRFEAIF